MGIPVLSKLGRVLGIDEGGTGAPTAEAARSALGLAIGSAVQAWSAALDTWAGKTAPSGAVVGTTDTQTLTNKSLTAPNIGVATGSSGTKVSGSVSAGMVYFGVANTNGATDSKAAISLDPSGNGFFSRDVQLIARHLGDNKTAFEVWTARGDTPYKKTTVDEYGRYGIGVSPTAMLHIQAGSNNSGLGAMKFTAGQLLATPEAGAFDYDGAKLYLTLSDASRHQVVLSDNATLPGAITVGASPYIYQNTSAFAQVILISMGTVSAIEYTRDNTTFYTVAASTTSPVLVTLAPNDRVRVAFSSTPTMIKTPL